MPLDCTSAPASCCLWVNQSPAQQSFMLMQLLNALLDSPLTLDQLKAAAAGYVCEGSPAKLRTIQAQLVADNLDGVVTAQPICWTPLQLSGAITYLYCSLLNQIA